MWWQMPVIPARGRQRQKDRVQNHPGLHSEVKTGLNYKVKLCLKKPKTNHAPPKNIEQERYYTLIMGLYWTDTWQNYSILLKKDTPNPQSVSNSPLGIFTKRNEHTNGLYVSVHSNWNINYS